MKYSLQDIAFILYNNRSTKLVKYFLDPSMDPKKLVDIEEKFDWCKSLYSHLESIVEIDHSLLDVNVDDVLVTPDDLNGIGNYVRSVSGIFSDGEIEFLRKRKFPLEVLDKYQMCGLSNFTDPDHLRIIGATCHPMLRPIIKDGIESGGIVFPLFEFGKLTNCAIRKISDIGKLKYTLAVPDIPVWGIDDISDDTVYVCEGIFDMIALRENGAKACTVSSAVWSGPQIYKLIESRPSSIIIFVDNDRVGFKNGAILKKFFNMVGVSSSVVRTPYGKDSYDHFFINGKGIGDLCSIDVCEDSILSMSDNSFDFLKHLQKRRF